jgi:hypothetical protein
MEWIRLDVGGRVTAMRGAACAGVTADGTGFTALLADHDPTATEVDELSLDSFGVVALSGGDTTWLTGRGPDGQMHLWQVAAPHLLSEKALDAFGAAWAAPALDAKASGLLVAYIAGDGWRMRAHTLAEGPKNGAPRGRELRLGGPPDSTLAYSFHERGPIMVAGAVGDAADPPTAAWVIDTDPPARGAGATDWRRVHLAPTPSALSSVGVAAGGRRTWIAGRLGAKPMVYEVLALPFRGLVRSATPVLPVLTLAPDSIDGPDRPVVLVDHVESDHPVFLAATVDGNRLCWTTGADGTSWQAFPAPAGRLHAACLAGGRIHALIDGSVWSLEDPTQG